jgi:CPA1 family monovalent cation:H+ antiporter
MHHLELIIGLLVVVAFLAWLASRISIAYPIVLVLGGLLLAAVIRRLPETLQEHLRFDLNPDLVFLIFLPPLLYYAGLLTSWRDFKGNLRPISMLAIGLVLFTMTLVAVAAHHFAGVSWAAAFVLGAIVSPPDAVAATAITSRLRVPRRIVTILEGESLVNDAGALVAYRIGIAVAVGTEQFSVGRATGWFFYAAIAGVAVGYAAGWLVAWVRPRVHDAAVESTISLLTPYIAYLPAEWLHASGVLSVVTAGIYLSRKLPQVTSPRVRLRAYAIWEAAVFILNGVIFILIGLQLPTILHALTGTAPSRLVAYAAVISGVCIAARLLWIFPATYIPRRLFPSLAERDPLPPWRSVLVIGWAGMRGIVSLAAALALPANFPDRELMLFITFGVILATLVLQGLTLPPLIRAMKLPTDSGGEDEETTARYLSALAAIERLDGLLGSASVTATEQAGGIARLRAEYDERIAYYSRRLAPAADGTNAIDGADGGIAEACTISLNVRREAITAERQMLVRLRDQGVIGDEALRAVQEELDLEESRLE